MLPIKGAGTDTTANNFDEFPLIKNRMMSLSQFFKNQEGTKKWRTDKFFDCDLICTSSFWFKKHCFLEGNISADLCIKKKSRRHLSLQQTRPGKGVIFDQETWTHPLYRFQTETLKGSSQNHSFTPLNNQTSAHANQSVGKTPRQQQHTRVNAVHGKREENTDTNIYKRSCTNI